MHGGRDRGGYGDGRIANPATIKSVGGCAVTFPGQVQINISLPGQNRPFVTAEIVRTHVRVQVASGIGGGSRVVAVVAAFIRRVVKMADGSHIRSNGGSFDARETGHT